MSDRLTAEQAREASEILDGIGKLLPKLRTKPWAKLNGTAKVYLWAEQLRADLSELQQRASDAVEALKLTRNNPSDSHEAAMGAMNAITAMRALLPPVIAGGGTGAE